MGDAACDVLEVELALDLLEGELATELPAHMRAFARAHADGRPPPSAPLILRLASTLQTARNAFTHDVLAERGLALLRLVVPLLIEDYPAVAAARREPLTWSGLAMLASARDAAALKWFGSAAIKRLHRLQGVAMHDEPATVAIVDAQQNEAAAAWHKQDAPLDQTAILDAWQAIASRLGVSGSVRIDRSASAKPRTFVIVPGAEAIVVVPAVTDTPAARFAVLHELGHAALALAIPMTVSRVLEEAAASYVARLAESSSWLPPRWASEHAAAARTRRASLAAVLDQIERALPQLPDPPPSSTPPWALWHDPGAQAAYVAAEPIADRLATELGHNPPRGQFARVLTAEHDRIDRAAGA